MMQNEQRLSQPSWTFRFGRVRSLAASNTGAASNSVWANMSETNSFWLLALSSCPVVRRRSSGVSAETGTNAVLRAACSECETAADEAASGHPFRRAGELGGDPPLSAGPI